MPDNSPTSLLIIPSLGDMDIDGNSMAELRLRPENRMLIMTETTKG